mgnify:CR=1 FL=1
MKRFGLFETWICKQQSGIGEHFRVKQFILAPNNSRAHIKPLNWSQNAPVYQIRTPSSHRIIFHILILLQLIFQQISHVPLFDLLEFRFSNNIKSEWVSHYPARVVFRPLQRNVFLLRFSLFREAISSWFFDFFPSFGIAFHNKRWWEFMFSRKTKEKH